MIECLIDHIFAMFNGRFFSSYLWVQTVLLLSSTYLLIRWRHISYRALSRELTKPAHSFNFTLFYTDVVLSLNNYRFRDFVDRIYPTELVIKGTTNKDRFASYLDLHTKLTLQQKILFQFSHCELSNYMQQHSCSTCIWSINL